MHRPFRPINAVLLVTLLSASAVAGGPWPREAGHGYLQLAWQFIPAYSSIYGPSGSTYSLPGEATDRTLQAYGEYGLGGGWTARLTVPLRFVEIRATLPDAEYRSGSLSGIGNVGLAVSRGFRAGAVPVGATLALDIPAPENAADVATGLRTGFPTWTVAPSLGAGHGGTGWYAFGEAGLQFRGDDYSQNWRLTGEAGWSPLRRLWLAAVVDVLQTLTEGAVPLPEQIAGFYLDNQQFIAMGLKAGIAVGERWGVNLATFGAAGAEGVPKSPAHSAAIYVTW